MSKSKRNRKRRLVRATKVPGQPPYRSGTAYQIQFEEASRKFWDKKELFKLVSKLTGKSQEKVKYDFAVLSCPNSSSNKGRSKVETNEQGLVKLVDIRISRGGEKVEAKPVVERIKRTIAKKPAIVTSAPVAAPVVTPSTESVPETTPEPAIHTA